MRIWSLHPKYLDTKGLVALWREALLAKKVLEGKTSGYKNHPQLYRFKKLNKPVDGIHQYMSTVYHEAVERGYSFNKSRIRWSFEPVVLTVTTGQLLYEAKHLLKKLQDRDPERYQKYKSNQKFDSHPIFNPVDGGVEKWEIVKE